MALKNNSFLKNFSILTAGEATTHAINMFTSIYLARLLSPTCYGEYSLLITYITLFCTISSLGLRQIVIRTIARNQDNSRGIFLCSILLRIYGYIIGVASFLVYNWFFPLGFSNYMVLMLLTGIFAQSFWDAFQNVAFGMQRVGWISIINVFFAFIILLIYMILPNNQTNLVSIVTIYVICNFLKDVVSVFCLFKAKLLTCKKEKELQIKALSMLKESFPFYFLSIFTMFSTQVPVIFLEQNSTIEEVAYFNTANKLLLPMTMLVNTALAAFFPNQAQLYAKDNNAFNDQTKKSFVFIAFCSSFLAILITIFRKEFILLLYGYKYINTSEVMAFQCWYLAMYTIFCFIGSAMAAADKQNLLSVCSVIYAIVCVPFLYCGTYYGAKGLAVSYILASLINMTYHYYYFNKIIGHRLDKTFTAKVFGSLMFTFFAAYSISLLSLGYRIIIALAIIFILYKSNFIKKILVKA